MDKDDQNPDQPGGKCRIVATSSDSQPGCSSSNSDVGSQVECETAIGELNAEERGQSQGSDEETAESKTLEKNGDKEDIPEQGSSKEGTSDTNAELKTEKSLDNDDDVKITAEENGVKDSIHEQGSSKEGTSDTNAEPVAGGSSVCDDEQPGCSR